jgi:hypothetical protein
MKNGQKQTLPKSSILKSSIYRKERKGRKENRKIIKTATEIQRKYGVT